jgi:DNA (cytosine-5)-methyltransferase 1
LGLNELALFAGAGGGILGGLLLGWRTVCAVEINEYCRRVLMQRQDDGCLEPFPIWDDIRTFDGRPWDGCVDIVSGGFPCQDISAAGKGAGITGERSGLWKEMARVIGEVRPRFVFVENSPMLTLRGLGTVLGDLSEMGFDAEWGVVSAADVGAPHQRERIWICAKQCGFFSHAEHKWPRRRKQQSEGVAGKDAANADGARRGIIPMCDTNRAGLEKRKSQPSDDGAEQQTAIGAGWWQSEPDVGRVAHGIPSRVDRLKAIGNAQVPAVAATAFRILSEL